MAGTRIGGKKTERTIKQRHGRDFYQRMGRKGGIKSRGGGFAADKERARTAGAIGGRVSSRKGVPNKKKAKGRREDGGNAQQKTDTAYQTQDDVEITQQR